MAWRTTEANNRDERHAVWRLACDAFRADAAPCRVECTRTGAIRTATFIRDDVRFRARELDFDFTIEAEKGGAVITFVRVVHLAHEPPAGR